MTATLPPISEREFMRQVLDLARVLSWRVAHFRAAETSHGWRTPVQADGAGFPDLVLVRGDRLLFVELKSEAGKLATAQVDWIAALDRAGCEVFVWRPSDLEYLANVLR